MIPDALRAAIARRKAELDARRPLGQATLRSLQAHYDVELTYTSNAIEGNTLTLRETAEVIEHGVTISGKPLRDYLEAVDHHAAVLWVRAIAEGEAPPGEAAICELHRRIVARSQPEIAGVYSRLPRRVAGSRAVFPNPAKIPDLMAEFGAWLEAQPATMESAFEAHFRLTAIHPFADGNGRCARLLMNLVLLRGGYPPVAVRPVDRARYLEVLESASMTGDTGAFMTVLAERLDETLADYLAGLGPHPENLQ
jgi:Fic family protein